MTTPKPIVCALGASDMQRRLESIATLGVESLIASETGDGTHILRFRSDEETRRGLTAIVAAEAECCSFLEIELSEHRGELVLTIAAPQEGQPVADGLAAAFAEGGSIPL
jgi:hypothetical protein